MPDGNMSPSIICLIFSCSYFASVHARINPPDFDSGWLTIQAADHKNVSLARKNISHGLGETPLLVDVQVKAIDGRNKDYVFQAVGHQIRDDDYPEDRGNVIYVYDSKSVIVSAPVQENGYPGKAICIPEASAWVGPNQRYYGYAALFRVRAWKESSLPPADFVSKSNVLTAGTVNSSYLEVFHGFGELPALVISRIRFPSTVRGYPNFYADSVGAGMIVYPGYSNAHAGYVVYGYNYNYIRVWAPSSRSPKTLFDGRDGSGIYEAVSSATLELFAWTLSSLTPDACNVISSCTNEKSAAIFSLTRAWAGPNDGANAGFIFPGSGSLAYRLQSEATPCTYGGLVYAYNNETIRFWRPSSPYGSIICIQNVFGHGTNSQASSDVQLFMFTWITDDNESSAGISPCNANVLCTKTVRIFPCQCKSGYTGNGQTCTDINECSSDISPCNVNANCTNTAGSFTCQCSSGYTGNGQTCTDVNECSAGISPCNVNANCTNTAGSFTCHCKSGYTGNGQTCTDGSRIKMKMANSSPIKTLQMRLTTITTMISSTPLAIATITIMPFTELMKTTKTSTPLAKLGVAILAIATSTEMTLIRLYITTTVVM